MADYIGTLKMFAFDFAPVDFEFCNGQGLQVLSYGALFSLIGTTFGSEGQQIFRLPDLRGRVPVHKGTGHGLSTWSLGEKKGTTNVRASAANMPLHNHSASAVTSSANSKSPGNSLLAKADTVGVYYNRASNSSYIPMLTGAVSLVGGSQPHYNYMPYLAINFCIVSNGIYPPIGDK